MVQNPLILFVKSLEILVFLFQNFFLVLVRGFIFQNLGGILGQFFLKVVLHLNVPLFFGVYLVLNVVVPLVHIL